jgi:hypothetical protein
LRTIALSTQEGNAPLDAGAFGNNKSVLVVVLAVLMVTPLLSSRPLASMGSSFMYPLQSTCDMAFCFGLKRTESK